MSGILWTSLVKLLRIFSILSMEKIENNSESDFISEKAGVDGDWVLLRILFIVFQRHDRVLRQTRSNFWRSRLAD